MGRRRKSGIEDLLTLVVRAPLPVGIVLAVVSFVVLNQITHGDPVQASATADMSRSVFTNLGITFGSSTAQ